MIARCVRLLMVLLCACGGSPNRSRPPTSHTKEPAPDAGALDSDHDGLCDSTEARLGTDPHAADTDGDGLPDVIEVGYGFNPIDAASPAPDQVGYLQAHPSAVLDFQVRVTVDGDGAGLSGILEPVGSIYSDDPVTVETFFAGANAVSADPLDGVRSVDAASAYFSSVLGRVRLAFSIRFEYPADAQGLSCGKAYKFRYGIKSDDGRTAGERPFLLVLSPDDQTGRSISYCLPRHCQ
jgi:Bacterial TSP3 repeat